MLRKQAGFGVERNVTKELLVVVFSVILTSGCYQISQYSGDGRLVDNGYSSAIDRYVLNLGQVDFTRRGRTTYRMKNLPGVDFVVGIEIATGPESRIVVEERLVNPVLSLELSQGGAVLFSKKSALSTWTWSVPRAVMPNIVYGEETYFTADSNAEYALTLSVLEPDLSQSKYTAHLVVKSGGWK